MPQEGAIYVATESFQTTLQDGTRANLIAGRTLVREGHELLRDHAPMFKLLKRVDYDIEQATAAPGEKRG